MRDLGTVDPWQESLERSRARRGRVPPPDPAPRARRVPPRRTTRIRWARLLNVGGVVIAFALLVVLASSVLSGPRGQGRAAPGQPSRAAMHAPVTARVASISIPGAGRCQPADPSSGYVNPLAGAAVRGERIDQGVDYAGTGMLDALGDATVTYVGTSATGWPGAFVAYRLLDGPDVGCFVYYAEGITPVPGLHAGQTIRPGEPIADIVPGWPTGVELGWGAGRSTKTEAATTGRWDARDDADSVASAAGRSFSALIAGLGGPPGKVEG